MPRTKADAIPSLKLYGISEIAESLGKRPGTVAQWYRRDKLPPPTAILKMGPVWTATALKSILPPLG